MQPKLYKTAHPRTPWLIVWSDPTQRDKRGKPKRFQKWFKNPTDAEKEHAALVKTAAQVGTAGLGFDARQRADFFGAQEILIEAGRRVSLTELARAYVKKQPPPAKPILLDGEDGLVNQFLSAKELEDNRQPATIANLRRRLNAWIIREDLMTLADITEPAVRALKQRPGVSPQTRVNDMAAVSSFLSYLCERGLIERNILLDIKRPSVDGRHPRILTAAQVNALLTAALEEKNGRLLRYFCLTALAGLRPTSEAAVIDEADVRIDAAKPIVRVLRGKLRKRPRTAPLQENFLAWWSVAPKVHPVFDWKRDRRLFNTVREAAGLIKMEKNKVVESVWQEDICRHTWISWRVEQTHDKVLVAYESGNSVDMIDAHYLSLMDEEEMKAIAALRPPKRLA